MTSGDLPRASSRACEGVARCGVGASTRRAARHGAAIKMTHRRQSTHRRKVGNEAAARPASFSARAPVGVAYSSSQALMRQHQYDERPRQVAYGVVSAYVARGIGIVMGRPAVF